MVLHKDIAEEIAPRRAVLTEIAFPAEAELAIASSGVHAVKTGAALELFNRASIRARKAAAAYNRAAGADCRHLRDVADSVGPDGLMDAMEAIRRGTEPADEHLDLPGRFEQFFREDVWLIPAVADAIAAGRFRSIGELMDASHAGAARGLQNQIDQTNFLQESARRLGALAASYFGAGFGGSVWAMAERGRGGRLLEQWRQLYSESFPEDAARSEFFLSRPGRPAEVLKG